MSPEDVQWWQEQLKDCEMRHETYRQGSEAAMQRIKDFKKNYGIKETSDGGLRINYDILVKGLGLKGAMELRDVIDETYNITGSPGEKPHVKLANG